MSELNSKLPRDIDLAMPVGNDEAKMFAGPESLTHREDWRSSLQHWKKDAIARLKYDGLLYSSQRISGRSRLNIGLIWLWDEILFDFDTQKFTPEKLIAVSEKFGGFDGIILWHAYPVIGIDSRNQFDFYNQVEGLSELIQDLKLMNIEVYLNYNPWDRWTKRSGTSDQIQLAQLVEKYKFDGVFLDTMKSAGSDFMSPIVKVDPEIIVGGESRVPLERICDHVMSWAQWFADTKIPGVLRAKWFEPRHMLHQTRRWNRSHIDEFHIAWLNGAGMLIWEVVFGSWVGWNQREACMWKEMVAILRENYDVITTGDWEPLTQLSREAEEHQIFASKFSQSDRILYTIINKGNRDFSGPLIPDVVTSIPAGGVAAIVINKGITQLTNFSYYNLSNNFQDQKPVMNSVIKGDEVELEITYRNRESGLFDGAPFIDAWKPLPPNYHQIFKAKVKARVRPGILHKDQTTNQEFFEFIQATGYKPRLSHRFLAHWVDGAPREQDLLFPVTFVDLDDAKAFAQWREVEIPTHWEWQHYAATLDLDAKRVWSLTDSLYSDSRTRFLILKGGSDFNIRVGQGAKSPSGIAESDWYVDGGVQDETWVEKYLLMGSGMSRSENIGFVCFKPTGGS